MKFEDEKKANILQKQLSSAFTREPEGEIPKLDIRANTCINNLLVTEEMLRREIVNLNVYKACGPDEINPRLLIELVDSISKPIALLLNETMKHGEIPKDWKRTNVSTIYKKGN